MRTAEFPAVREAEASGEISVIFADIRATLGVPFVNLIWRHLATMPGMLEWCWRFSKPLYGSMEHAKISSELQTIVRSPVSDHIPPFVFDAAELNAGARGVIAALIGAYNKANAGNLAALLVVQSVLAGYSPGGRGLRPNAATKTVPRPLPDLLQLSGLNASTQSLIMSLDQFGRSAPSNAVASLYCHLAHWPSFLAIVHTALAAVHRSGALKVEHERVLQRSKHLAKTELLPLASPVGLPRQEQRARSRASIESFTELMIARMLVMGNIMLGLLPDEEGS